MSNYGIKLNLTKIKGHFFKNIQGKNETKRCICFPFDTLGFYEGEKTVYLDLVAFEYREPKYADTHMLKISIAKEIFDAMTDEEKNSQPIVGGLKPIVAAARGHIEITGTTSTADEGEDLPF